MRALLSIIAAILLAAALGGCFSITLRGGYGGPNGVNGEIELDFRERVEANRPANVAPTEDPTR